MKKTNIFYTSYLSRSRLNSLEITFSLSDEELSFLIKLFQVFKYKKMTNELNIENFVKKLIFDNVDYFKKLCDYDEFYNYEKK